MSGWMCIGNYTGSTGLPGESNCYSWTSDDAVYNGTTVFLTSKWVSNGEDIGLWNVDGAIYFLHVRVWCGVDVAGFPMYLP